MLSIMSYFGLKLGIGAFTPVSLFVSLCILSYGLMTMTRKARMINRFPGIPILPIIGSAYAFLCHPTNYLKMLSKLIEKNGRCFHGWIFHRPYIIIAEVNAAKAVLGSSKHIEKGRDYEPMKLLLGEGLITSSGQKWREDRKLLSPSFHYQTLDKSLHCFNQHSKILVEILKEKFPIGEVGMAAGPKNLHPYFARFKMDCITESSLGTTTSFQRNPDIKFVETMAVALSLFRRTISEPWLKMPVIPHISGFQREALKCRKYFEEHLLKIIAERRKIRTNDTQEMEGRAKPFIDALLDANKSNMEIIDQVLTLFAAGFETMAAAMNYTMYLLALNLEEQKKVHEELDRVFKDDLSRDVTFADLSELKYLEMCIKEVMRLYPPNPFFTCIAQNDIPLENNLVIPKGCDVVILTYHLHRDKRVFPDPEKFDPERFHPDQCARRSAYAYTPFSAGPRNCLGQKYAMILLKAVLAHVLRTFSVSTKLKREDLKLNLGIILEPAGEIELLLHRRNSSYKI